LFDQGIDTQHLLPRWAAIVSVTAGWMFFTGAILWGTAPIRAAIYN